MPSSAVIRLHAEGPPGKGLSSCRFIDPASVIEGRAEEAGFDYFENSTGQVHGGVWRCSPCVERVDGYPFDEFCTVLEGCVEVEDDQGRRETFRAGDSFIMPRGFKGTWHMTEPFKKFYFYFDEAAGV